MNLLKLILDHLGRQRNESSTTLEYEFRFILTHQDLCCIRTADELKNIHFNWYYDTCRIYGISIEVEAVELETEEAFLWLRIWESVSLFPVAVVVKLLEAPVTSLSLFPTLMKVSSRNMSFILALKNNEI